MGPWRIAKHIWGAALVVLAFAICCAWLVRDVAELRAGVEGRVRGLISLRAMEEELSGALSDPSSPDRIASARAAFVAAREHLDPLADAELGAALDRVDGALVGSAPQLEQARTGAQALVGLLRRQNGSLSAALGARWNLLGAVVAAALALALGLIAVLVLSDRRRQELEALRDALQIAAAEASAAREQAEAANRAKSSFVARMSHDLRSPMTGVIGMAELLCTTPLSLEQAEFVDVLRRSGDFLVEMVNQLLDLARLESGELLLESSPVDVLGVMEEALLVVAPAAHGRGLALLLDFPDDVPRWFVGDSLRIKQVLVNLLANAVKFTARGSIRIEAAVEPTGVLVAVHDTGEGIEPALLQQVFEPFVRGHTDRKDGAGLGLAIVQTLVQAMGGTVEVRSVKGEGSCFTAHLPLAASPALPERPLATLAGQLVVVVDPEPFHRATWARALGPHGAQVCAVASEEAASALEARYATLLVVSDCLAGDLPRIAERWPATPVVLVAALGEANRGQSADPTVAGVIYRPLRQTVLAERVASFLLETQEAVG